MHKTYRKSIRKFFFLISIMAVSFFAPLKSFQLKWLIDSNSKKRGEYLLNGKTKGQRVGERKG